MLLLIGTNGVDYNTVICLTSQTYARTTEEIDAATKCGPDKQAGPQSNNVTFEGQTMLDPSGGRISTDDLDDHWRNVTTIYWKLTELQPQIGSIIYYGTGFISALSETYDLTTPSTFSGAIGIYGLAGKTTATS